jgi:hypothetical protein
VAITNIMQMKYMACKQRWVGGRWVDRQPGRAVIQGEQVVNRERCIPGPGTTTTNEYGELDRHGRLGKQGAAMQVRVWIFAMQLVSSSDLKPHARF